MRFFIVLLMLTLAVSFTSQSTAKTPEQAAISMVTSPNAVRVIGTGNKRLLRAEDDTDNEERAIDFKSLAKKLNSVFSSKPKEAKIPIPKAKQLEMMSYRDDVAFPFFKAWVEYNLPLAVVQRTVKSKKIADNFASYKITATGGL
ncbi:hypothetical protein PHYBOEH_011423 [Phytophthora boehmeriae]|uniref:RxLR effector protein n=1 Tax=Phytophthora boehmeriae TaxID=109152 RepID=A0A8T1X3K4_9STRA|nr:hypothetical protein PHYBOEH_011423 [Phytophthora boehmeriae]